MSAGEQIIVKPLELAVNLHRLKSKGLKYIEELAGELWTNFNDSDPGVTILEQLCYALTELGYCNNFAIEDILADQTDQIEYQGQFFTPEQSLTTSPVTIADFRKLLIDQVTDLNNVSLIPEVETGRYQVWLYPGQGLLTELQKLHEFTEGLISPGKMQDAVFYADIGSICDELVALIDCFLAPGSEAEINHRLARVDKFFVNEQSEANWLNSASMTKLKSQKGIAVKFQTLLNQADSCLNQHRNMAELFYFPAIFIPQTIILKGQIHLKPKAVPEQLAQKLALSLEAYACGYTRQRGYQELIDSGLQSNDIFNGPSLQQGWIRSTELGNKRDVIHLLEVIKLISELAEVVTTDQLELFVIQNGQSQHQSVIAVGKNQVALFKVECQFIQQQPMTLPFSSTPNSINLQQLQLQHQNQPINAQLDLSPVLPQGKSRHIEPYYSVQNTFPSVYGIGEESLPDDAGEHRLAQAKQLKGYLMVFDQLIANQFSQLAHSAELFSFKPVSTLAQQPKRFKGIPTQLLPPTYYCQPLYQVPNVKTLLKGNNSYNFGFKGEDDASAESEVWSKFQQDPFNQYMIGLRACMEDDIEISERRNKMLDHLLARHGYSGALFDQLITRIRWYGDQSKTQMMVKTLILQNWQGLSYHRNNAFNTEQAEPLPNVQVGWKIFLLQQQNFQPWLVELLKPFRSGRAHV